MKFLVNLERVAETHGTPPNSCKNARRWNRRYVIYDSIYGKFSFEIFAFDLKSTNIKSPPITATRKITSISENNRSVQENQKIYFSRSIFPTSIIGDGRLVLNAKRCESNFPRNHRFSKITRHHSEWDRINCDRARKLRAKIKTSSANTRFFSLGEPEISFA